jgi:hypothetical protein
MLLIVNGKQERKLCDLYFVTHWKDLELQISGTVPLRLPTNCAHHMLFTLLGCDNCRFQSRQEMEQLMHDFTLYRHIMPE